MKYKNMLSVVLSDDEVDFLDALCHRLRASPDQVVGKLICWAAIFAFSDAQRCIMLGRQDTYWSNLEDEKR